MSTATAPSSSSSTFAGVMLLVLGVMNVINGFVLLEKAHWVANRFIFSTADTWAWIVIGFAVLQILAGFRLVTSTGGRTLALTLASVGLVLWFCLMFAAPIASLIGMILNFTIIASVLSADPS